MPVCCRVEETVSAAALCARPIRRTSTDERGTAAHTSQISARIEIRYKTSPNGRKKAQQNRGKQARSPCERSKEK